MKRTGISLLLSIIVGAFYGYAIGFQGVYIAYNQINTNCAGIAGKEACDSLEHAHCVWAQPSNASLPEACLFDDYATVHCSSALIQGDCTVIDGCYWDFASGQCNHNPQWTPLKTGIFAGALIVGGMIGSLIGGALADKLGRKKTIIFVGIMGIISCVMLTASRAAGIYALLIVSRVVLGTAAGVACVVVPLFVQEMTEEKDKGWVSAFYQIAITFGIVIAAAIGYFLQPLDLVDDMKMEMRFQVLIGAQSAFSILSTIIGFVMPESDEWLERIETEVSSLLQSENKMLKRKEDKKKELNEGFPVKKLIGPLIGGFFLGTSLQLTGINAIMNYSPEITKAAGLPSLLGNLIVMAWNFVTTLISIPLSKKFPHRPIYLFGTFAASAACFLTGIPTFPGVVEDKTTRHALAGLGIVLFVGIFEMSMGPPFYPLSQRLFPTAHRATGSSFTLGIQFVANLIINTGFPLTVTALSGGPSGDQHKGLAATFMIFGSVGMVCFAVLFKTLHYYPDEEMDSVDD